MSLTQIAVLTFLMVVTGAIGAITGGNSLINVPLMITVGMSPRHAVATNMFAVMFMTISATARFAKSGILKQRRDLLVPLAIITAFTSAFGALIAIKLSEVVVKTVVGLSMGALVLFMALRRGGGQPVPSTPRRRQIGYAAATALGIYGGFFSGGYTTLMTVLCTVTFGLTMMESVAITKPINLVSCAAASVVFFAGGLVDLRIGVPLAAANLLGGWLGAHAAIKQGDKFVRLLFLLTVGALALKLLIWDVLLRG
jgi:uncharacterized membrane protein YfcA